MAQPEKISQIYDKIFKRIITLSGPAVIRFINTVFGQDFDLSSEITYNLTESVDDNLGKTISDTILTINGTFKFHMEVEISPADSSIALRMFEYGIRDAIKHKEIGHNKIVLTMPEARIIYLEHTDKTPGHVELALSFQGREEVFTHKIKTEKLLSYTIEDLNSSGMVILMPLYLLKLRREIVRHYETRADQLAQELKNLIEQCIIAVETNQEQGNITSADTKTLLGLFSILYKQLYADYEIFKKEGVDTVLRERLLTPVEEKAVEIAKNALKEGLAIELIAKLTGFTEETIRQLQDELDD